MTNDKPCGTCDSCEDPTCLTQRPDENEQEFLDRKALFARMSQIKHKILVLSGKGGVGKSTVAVNLAANLALAGKQVGLLDVDIHGPSVPKLLHLVGTPVTGQGDKLIPIKVGYGVGNLNVMSIGFLLREQDDAVIWRGPRKFGVIRQFLKDVEWGKLDYLIVDAPPGTGDEPLAAAQLIQNADGAIVVTTPQQVSVQDVRRCIVFCKQLQLPVLGVLENMSGFACPKCGEVVQIFGADGGRAMAEEMEVPFWGSIPLEPAVVESGDNGIPIVQVHSHSETAKAFGRIVRKLMDAELSPKSVNAAPSGGGPMRIAVPMANGVLASHFGHCDQFVLVDIEGDGKTIGRRQVLTPPPHEPGTFPKWLHEQGATTIIAGGMGSRAQSLFTQNNIQVIVGAGGGEVDAIVRSFLDGSLQTSANICDH